MSWLILLGFIVGLLIMLGIGVIRNNNRYDMWFLALIATSLIGFFCKSKLMEQIFTEVLVGGIILILLLDFFIWTVFFHDWENSEFYKNSANAVIALSKLEDYK